MSSEKDLNKIIRLLQDHENRIAKLENKNTVRATPPTKEWYQPESTIGKIILLIEEGFFKAPRTISEIIAELKTKDYHLKTSGLTLPLRKIVRKKILKRTKTNADGSLSKKWLYVKA
jgi:hypothetical protein